VVEWVEREQEVQRSGVVKVPMVVPVELDQERSAQLVVSDAVAVAAETAPCPTLAAGRGITSKRPITSLWDVEVILMWSGQGEISLA